jgi:hypothetical protein
MDSTITHFLYYLFIYYLLYYGTGQARHGHETAGVREGGGEGEDDSIMHHASFIHSFMLLLSCLPEVGEDEEEEGEGEGG